MLLSLMLQAQGKYEVVLLEVNPQENRKTATGVQITLEADGKTAEKFNTGSKGKKFSTVLMDNREYIITVGKSNYYTYKYSVSTRIPKTKARNIDEMGPSEVIIFDYEMFEKFPGFEPRLFTNVLSKWSYDGRNFTENKAYAAQVSKKFREYADAFHASEAKKKQMIEEIKEKEGKEKEEEEKAERTGSGTTSSNATVQQGPFYLQLSGSVMELGEPVDNATIKVSMYKSQFSLKSPLQEDSYKTDASGRYVLKLSLEKAYKITFFKNGFYAKTYFVNCDRLLGQPFSRSYDEKMDVELLKIKDFQGIRSPRNLTADYDKVIYNKKADRFGLDDRYASMQPDAKDLHRFFDEVRKRWERYYEINGRETKDIPEPKEEPEIKKEIPEKKDTKVTKDVTKKKPPKTDAQKDAEARRNRALKEEEERRLRAEIEERERLEREAEAERLRLLQEAEQRALAERLQREAEAQAAFEEHAKKQEVKRQVAEKVQVAKKERNVEITRELAVLERNIKEKTAEQNTQSGKKKSSREPVIKPVITVEEDDGYITDTRTITIKYPGKKTVYKEETSWFIYTIYYKNGKEIDEATFKKELSGYNIK